MVLFLLSTFLPWLDPRSRPVAYTEPWRSALRRRGRVPMAKDAPLARTEAAYVHKHRNAPDLHVWFTTR